MLLQSWGGEMFLLPALPAAWRSGSVKGIRAKGGLVVDLAWADGQLTSLAMQGPSGSSQKITANGRQWTATLSGGVYRYISTGP